MNNYWNLIISIITSYYSLRSLEVGKKTIINGYGYIEFETANSPFSIGSDKAKRSSVVRDDYSNQMDMPPYGSVICAEMACQARIS